MKRWKTSALAVGVAAALCAVGAGPAMAEGGGLIRTDPFWLTGENEEGGTNGLTALEAETICAGGSYAGGAVAATNGEGHHEPLQVNSTSFTLSASFPTCSSGGGLPETVTMNGCDYVFSVGKTNGIDKYAATTELVCPEGKEVVIDIYANKEAHEAESVICTLHMPPTEAAVEGAYVKDQTNGHLTIGGEAGPLTATVTGPSACVEETTTDTNGYVDLAITLTGTDAPTNGDPVKLGFP